MSIKAMKLALDLLGPEAPTCCGCAVEWNGAISALPTAIQQAESEPVAWMASYVDPIGNDHVYVTSHHDLAVENDMHSTPRPLYTHPAPGVPEGYVLVPVDPTDEMLGAAFKFESQGSGIQGGDLVDVWKAMLTAAQAQKGQP